MQERMDNAATPRPPARVAPVSRSLRGARTRRVREGMIQGLLLLLALLSIFTTVGIVLVLIFETVSFFREVSIIDFLTGTRWTPLFARRSFGVLPLLSATLMIAITAMLVAVPVGLGAAIFLSEYARPTVRSIVKPILEILAGIPTVVYGYFALTFITPNIIRPLFPDAGVFNALSASLVMGIMIVPMVSSLSEDAMSAVPRDLREGAYSLGATSFEVATRVVVPAALSGIVASFILGMSRAVGETMIVTLAAGGTPNLSWNPLEGMQTVTAYIVAVSLGDTPQGTLEYKTIFAVGFLLFVITLLMNAASRFLLEKFREVYE